VLELGGQPALQGEVLGRRRLIGAQEVPESDLVLETGAPGWNEMQVVCAPPGVGLAEPVHLVGKVRRVEVVELGQGLEARARGLEIGDADEDVDDRLRFEARDRGAADVVDTADRPVADRRLEECPLALEPGRPRRVVGDQPDRLVGALAQSSEAVGR
jgi:hypothetical protein